MIQNINPNQSMYNLKAAKSVIKADAASNSEKKSTIKNTDNSSIAFKGIPFFMPLPGITNPEDKAKYKELASFLSPKDDAKLNVLLKTGKLLNKDSNDGSSTLDNLYNIMKTPRVLGLDNKEMLSETLTILENPFIVTQNFGDLPPEIIQNQVNTNLANKIGLEPNSAKSYGDMNVDASGTCVAASIEFNLAHKKPAEFARYINGLTSPDLGVNVKLQYNDIAPNLLDAVNYLKEFKVPFKILDWNNIEVTLKPDRNAIVRARVQASHAKPETRLAPDVLLQSTFMQLGSQSTYNSNTDKRYGSFNPNEKGLTEFEKNFTESIVDNNGGKTSVTYQIVDDNAALTGYNYDFNTVKTHLLDALKSGENVIIGITEIDENKKIICGHEITVIGTRTDKNGDLYFICNDTDDDHVGAVEIKDTDLIPKIHHAGIPNNVLSLPTEEPYSDYLLKEYERAYKEEQAPNVA